MLRPGLSRQSKRGDCDRTLTRDLTVFSGVSETRVSPRGYPRSKVACNGSSLLGVGTLVVTVRNVWRNGSGVGSALDYSRID